MLPAAGAVVLVSLTLAARRAALAERDCRGPHRPPPGAPRAPARDELVETIDGAAELVCAGRAGERVERLRATDAELVRDSLAATRSPAALATALGGALTGSGCAASCWSSRSRRSTPARSRACCWPRSPSCSWPPRGRRAAARGRAAPARLRGRGAAPAGDLRREPPRSLDPAAGRCPRAGGERSRSTTCSCATGPSEPWVARRRRPAPRARGARRARRPERRRQDDARRAARALPRPRRRPRDARRRRRARADPGRPAPRRPALRPGRPPVQHHDPREPPARPARSDRRGDLRTALQTVELGRLGARAARRPRHARRRRTASSSPAASASASRSPARCSPTRAS